MMKELAFIVSMVLGGVIGWNLDRIITWIKRYRGIKGTPFKDKRVKSCQKTENFDKG